jgi:hypothetical protein
MAQPRRLVREQRERGRVRLREAEARRSRAPCRRSRARAARRGPLPIAPSTNRPRNASIAASLRLRESARRSPSASPIEKPATGHRDLEHLVLEDDRAERLAQRLLEQRMLDGRHVARVLAHRLAPVDERVHRLRLDRAGPHDRDLDRQVVEVLRPRAQQRLHLRARLDLERADGVRVLDLPVHVGVVAAECARGRSSRRARARPARRSPRPPRASRARAGRSSGSPRRSTSPCPTAPSGGRPSRTAARGRARSAAASR